MNAGAAGEGASEGSAMRPERILEAFDFAAAAAAQDARHLEQLSSLLEGLLVVLDSLDRVVAGTPADAPAASSCRLIARQVEALLERTGVQSPTRVGALVDLSRDEIVEVQSSEQADGVVLEVLARGYEWEGRILRHARVVVASNEEGAGT